MCTPIALSVSTIQPHQDAADRNLPARGGPAHSRSRNSWEAVEMGPPAGDLVPSYTHKDPTGIGGPTTAPNLTLGSLT
jgi:hypothetical protein